VAVAQERLISPYITPQAILPGALKQKHGRNCFGRKLNRYARPACL